VANTNGESQAGIRLSVQIEMIVPPDAVEALVTTVGQIVSADGLQAADVIKRQQGFVTMTFFRDGDEIGRIEQDLPIS
jgi:hypothetical protein